MLFCARLPVIQIVKYYILHQFQTDLFRHEVWIVDVFLQFLQDLWLDIVFVIVCQTPEEICIS